MSQRTVYTCDTCQREISEGEARYTLLLAPQENAQAEEIDQDVCGRCSGVVRATLHQQASPESR